MTNISYEQSVCFCLQNWAQYGDLAIFSWTTTPIVPLVYELSVVEITVFLFFAFCKCKCKCSFFRSKEQPWRVYGLNWNMISIDYVLQFFSLVSSVGHLVQSCHSFLKTLVICNKRTATKCHIIIACQTTRSSCLQITSQIFDTIYETKYSF